MFVWTSGVQKSLANTDFNMFVDEWMSANECPEHFITSQSNKAALLTFWDLSTTMVIAGKTHSQPPFLKTKGAKQPSNSYTYMGTKLHPAYPNQTA